MAKRKMTAAERAEWEAEHERMRANTEWLRQLAEKGKAKLDAQRSGLIEVWLEPADVEWLATHAESERIRARANDALHHARLN